MFMPILDYVKPLYDSYTTYLPLSNGIVETGKYSEMSGTLGWRSKP